MSALLLFDIDGTLLLSGGAGVRGMRRAFEDVFGVADAFAGIEVAGRTDRYILSQAFQRAGIAETPEHRARFHERYLTVLPEELQQPGSGRKQVMPGVRELLEALAPIDSAHVALLTGNYQRAAHLKLSYFDLASHFPWGVFGDEASDRNELGVLALARARAQGVPDDARRNAIVIGDTPHDVACARAAGIRALAVATGLCSFDDLAATDPDVVLRDLSDTEAVLRLLL